MREPAHLEPNPQGVLAHSLAAPPASPRSLPQAAEAIPALDGLRGVAIGLVLFCHSVLQLFWPLAPIHHPLMRLLVRVLGAGWSGVDLFFVLSGFLITRILLRVRGERRNLGVFYVRRALRILPLYLGVLVMVFGVLANVPGASDLVARIAPAQGWLWLHCSNLGLALHPDLPLSAGWLRLTHFWSLSLEEEFYLLWPFMVFALPARALGASCAAYAVVAWLVRLACLVAGAPSPLALALVRADGLALGALAALALHEGWLEPARLGLLARRALAASGCVVLGLAGSRGLFELEDPVITAWGLSALQVLWVAVLLLALQDGPWKRFLEGRGLRALGRCSYALYVFHPLAFGLLSELVAGALRSHGDLPRGWLVAAVVVAGWGLSIAVAELSWQLYEVHFVARKVPYHAPVP